MRTLAEIGQELRQARQARGRTLEELAAQTHLKASHLRAIEEGDEASLPEPVYIKSFIRKFAQAVGLPGDDLANQYWETKPLPPMPDQKREFSPPWWIFPWAIAALLVGVVVYFFVTAPRDIPEAGPLVVPSAPPTAAPASPSATASVASPSMPAATGALPVRQASPTFTPSPGVLQTVPQGGEPAAPQTMPTVAPSVAPTAPPAPATVSVAPDQALRLRLIADAPTWIQVSRDGLPVYRGTLRSGESMAWSAEDELNVTIGNAGGVEVVLSDRSLGKLGGQGEVIRRVFKRAAP